jgi:hypothetical protein
MAAENETDRWRSVRALHKKLIDHYLIFEMTAIIVLSAVLMRIVFQSNASDSDKNALDIIGTVLMLAILLWRGRQWEYRRNMRQLVHEAASTNYNTTRKAVDQLRRNGLLTGRNGRLQGQNLSRADFFGAELAGANFRGANLTRVRLTDVDLRRADLRDVVLTRGVFGYTDLLGADLRGARADGAAFTNTDLPFTDLENTSLRAALLNWTFLLNANLQNADLRNANLEHAFLIGANLTHATFNENTKFDTGTCMPDDQYWTPSADLGRYTDPQHPDFWRSTDKASPAFPHDLDRWRKHIKKNLHVYQEDPLLTRKAYAQRRIAED